MMLWMRGFSDCWETASSASSSGSPALASVASWRVSSDRSEAEMPRRREKPASRLRLAVLDLGHGDGQQLAVAQQLPHVLDGVAFDDAILFAARGVERGVFECTHGRSAPARISPRA
jgi:hypothetical protein